MAENAVLDCQELEATVTIHCGLCPKLLLPGQMSCRCGAMRHQEHLGRYWWRTKLPRSINPLPSVVESVEHENDLGAHSPAQIPPFKFQYPYGRRKKQSLFVLVSPHGSLVNERNGLLISRRRH